MWNVQRWRSIDMYVRRDISQDDVCSPGVSIWSRVDGVRSGWDGVSGRATRNTTLASQRTLLPRLLTSTTSWLRLVRLLAATLSLSSRLQLVLILLHWSIFLWCRRPNKQINTRAQFLVVTSCCAGFPEKKHFFFRLPLVSGVEGRCEQKLMYSFMSDQSMMMFLMPTHHLRCLHRDMMSSGCAITSVPGHYSPWSLQSLGTTSM